MPSIGAPSQDPTRSDRSDNNEIKGNIMKSAVRTGSAAAVAALLALGPLHASADQFADTYGYVGASVGNAKVKADPADVRFSEWDTSWKVFAGYMFNENIGAEIGYHDMGSPDDSGFEVSELTVFTTQVIGVLPLGQFDLFAKVGLGYYDAEFEYATGSTPTRNGIELASGFGARYNFGNFAIRAEAEVIDVDFGDLYNLSVGAQYRF
jgi:hypothetical protein